MQLSEQGKQHLLIDEGCKTRAYKDSIGVWTIGIGFTEINNRPVSEKDNLTKEQIYKMLPEILSPYENAVNKGIHHKMYQYEFDGLLCFCYNIGIMGFQTSQVVKAFNDGNKQLATLYFFNWRTPVEIIGRRYKDALLFCTGEYLK